MCRYLFATLFFCVPMIAVARTPQRFNVRAFGAIGDGVADDQPALIRAAQAVAQNKGGVLYFPHGVYRCARQKGMQNGIEFIGISDVTVLFDPGAVLCMDNLNPQSGAGDRGHGILFRGPCRNISVVNAIVKWAKMPAARSMGDAFRFEGFPADDRCIASVHLLHCTAEQCPQVGAIFMGCSEIDVEDFHVTRTRADGLHFNACRRVHVNGLTGIETGDDTLSFVTYEDDNAVHRYTGAPGSYACADLGPWNSNGSTVTNVYAAGGGANGVRLAGAMNVAVSNVIVEGKLRGIISDCGKKEANKHSWSWLASRGIVISSVVAADCTSGFYVANFNQPMSGDDQWWRFDLQLSNLSAENCGEDGVFISEAAGVTIRGIKAENDAIRLLHARDCTLDAIDLKNGRLVVERQADIATTRVSQTPSTRDSSGMDVIIQSLHIDSGSGVP